MSPPTKSSLAWDKLAPKLGSWARHFFPFYEQGGFDEIFTTLKAHSLRGMEIAPVSTSTFRCFQDTPYDSLKVVIIGTCPYHTKYKDQQIADGLCMSNSNNPPGDLHLAPTLEQFYAGLENDLEDGLCLQCVKQPSLYYLATQGVLLYNAALTTRIGEAKTHQKLWEPFSRYFLREVISLTGVPVIFLGNEAGKLEDDLVPWQDRFLLSHPASASYNSTTWNSEGAFTKVNEILKANNNETIQWFDKLPF
jgi:uracil-DNA glycosylase